MAAGKRRGIRRWLGWKGAALLGLGTTGVAALALAGAQWRRTRAGRGALDSGPELPRRRAWVPGPAGSLYLEEVGHGGLPLILVHGLAGSTRHWQPLLDLLGRRRQVVALDLRGHGRSDPAVQGEYHVEDYASDVLAVADALRLRTFALAGHSLGGLVAVECAGRHPERVAALALIDPSGDSSQRPRGEVESLLTAVGKEPRGEVELHFRQLLAGARPSTSEVVLEDLGRTPEEVLVSSLRSAMSYPGVEILGRYPGTVGCLVTPFNQSPASLPRLLPDLPVRGVRGTSHWLMLDRPADLAQTLEQLLEQVPAPILR